MAHSSRARPSKDECIDAIVRMMVERTWRPGPSHKALAVEWSMHPRVVQEYACRASAVVQRLGGPLDEWVEQKLSELEALQEKALNHIKVVVVDKVPLEYPAADVKAAVEAVKLQLQARGALIQRHEVKQVDVPEAELVPRMVAAIVEQHPAEVVGALVAKGYRVEPPAAALEA